MQLRLHNTLTRRVEPLVPSNEGEIRMYSCGPTVYRPVHVGNLRSYLLADWLRRTFELFGHRVVSVKNITDVGHMRQDAVDRGEDKVIAAALAAGQTPAEIARFYEAAFREDERRLGILPATVYPRATAHVVEMIALIQLLLAKDLAYVVGGTVYYAVKRFARYGRLSGNVAEALRQGVRAEVDPNKRSAADFALWKRAEPGRRALVWTSPWGPGYPGWHIECSAMSLKYLGERFDVHTGGVDNIFPHHEDEIAQSEGALGHQVVGTWVHGQHLLADGVKMAKSARNTLEIDEIEALGLDPLAFRYQCLLTHYRARMHFSVAALRQAAEGLDHLRQRIRVLAQAARATGSPPLAERVSAAFGAVALDRWRELFRERLADDLDLPRALALVQACVADADIPPAVRLRFVEDADTVLGLDLAAVAREHVDAPVPLLTAVAEHARARAAGDYAAADVLRSTLAGLRVDDLAGGVLVAREDRRLGRRVRRTISSPRELPDARGVPPLRSWSVCVLTREWPDDVARCMRGVLGYLPADGEVLVLDQGSSEHAKRRIDELAARDHRVQVHHADRDFGEGAGRNALLRIARGRSVLALDASVEITGPLFAVLERALGDGAGIAGPWGLRTSDMKHFDEATGGDCDAIQGYCQAVRRDTLLAIGGFDERYRFYRNLDIAVSCAVRELGLRARAIGADHATRHAHRVWEALSDEEREKRSRKNHDRMYRRFRRIAVIA
ncbi:MAG TPA: cysteine--tRNA ligase [Candidatus Limnocylindria bacterium]|nr:cysteine--tRNA ligase [Candidatus Limnocylindria bacterium]